MATKKASKKKVARGTRATGSAAGKAAATVRSSRKVAKPPKRAHPGETFVIATSPLVEIRESPIHGRGVYAKVRIVKGARIIEYVGDRVSHEEADRRYETRNAEDGHTFLFIVDNRTVIDGGVGGNEARYINHSCAPNCETVTDRRRIFVEALRTIKPGEELCYDYQLTWESTDTVDELAPYVCRCGARQCRGFMLDVIPLDKQKELAAKKRRTANRRNALARERAKAA